MKTIYNYHPITKEYIGSSLADESPLEKGIYLIPANATEIEPPEQQENKIRIFINNSWQYNDYENNSEQTPPQPTLEELKQDKINELNAICNQTILSGFDSTAKNNELKHYDFSIEDQTNIIGILNAINAGLPLPIYWKASDELVSYEWTVEEFKQLYLDGSIFKLQTIQKFHNLRENIVNVCTTQEEVENISWN